MNTEVENATDCLEVIVNIFECNPDIDEDRESEMMVFTGVFESNLEQKNQTVQLPSEMDDDGSFCSEQESAMVLSELLEASVAPQQIVSGVVQDLEMGRHFGVPRSAQFYHPKEDTMEDGQKLRTRLLHNEQNTWTRTEVRLLSDAINIYGETNWTEVAKYINDRSEGTASKTSNQCNERWNRVENPILRKGKWTPDEDKQLIEAVLSSPPKKWTAISAKLAGRTDIEVRYRLAKIGHMLVTTGVLADEYLP